MKLKKCPEHGYTLKGICGKCRKETKDAHYKFFREVCKNQTSLMISLKIPS